MTPITIEENGNISYLNPLYISAIEVDEKGNVKVKCGESIYRVESSFENFWPFYRECFRSYSREFYE